MKKQQTDKCQVCLGAQGGVPGNENIIRGVVICDYCHALARENEVAKTALEKGRETMTADQARKQWIAQGMMNGDNTVIMKSLYQSLPTTSDLGDLGQWDIANQYMAELWLRGVTKEDFMKEMGLDSV